MKHVDEQELWEQQRDGRLKVAVTIHAGMIRRAWRWLFGPKPYKPRTLAAPESERRNR